MGLIEDKLVALAETDADVAEALGGGGDGPVGEGPGAADVDITTIAKPLLHRAKAAVLADAALPAAFKWEGLPIKVRSVERVGDDLRVTVAAPCPLDNPYVFVNPPIGHGGVEDPAGALRAIVGRAVLAYARSRGWRAS